VTVSAVPALNGVLLVDKSPGPTSHDVVEAARRALRTRSIGHTGTLDPFASGLLVLCVGRATRLTEYFHLPDKRYEAELLLGQETTSHDPEGEVVAESRAWRGLTLNRVGDILRGFEGVIDQRPPALSAKRIGGQRAHALVRQGADVRLPRHRITIHSLRILRFDPPVLRLAARVSTGTYMRSLARDLGRELGCGAHLTVLRRTAIADLSAADAIPDAELRDDEVTAGRILGGGSWLEPGTVLSWLASRRVTEMEIPLLRTGRLLEMESDEGDRVDATGTPNVETEGAAGDPGPVRLLYRDRLVAIAELRDGRIQPRKVFLD
jgi:tRNA pseudouridine55 synthase